MTNDFDLIPLARIHYLMDIGNVPLAGDVMHCLVLIFCRIKPNIFSLAHQPFVPAPDSSTLFHTLNHTVLDVPS
jgi:hypothetical protein